MYIFLIVELYKLEKENQMTKVEKIVQQHLFNGMGNGMIWIVRTHYFIFAKKMQVMEHLSLNFNSNLFRKNDYKFDKRLACELAIVFSDIDECLNSLCLHGTCVDKIILTTAFVNQWACSWNYIKTKICRKLLLGHILVLS